MDAIKLAGNEPSFMDMTSADAPVTGRAAPAPEWYPILGQLMAQSNQGYALFDGSDVLRYANSFFRQAFGLGADDHSTWADILREGHRRSMGTVVQTDDFETWLASAKSRRGKLPWRAFESDLADGRWVLITECTAPNGWMLCVFTEITELGADSRKLRQERDLARKESLSDPLTGVSNRRYLMRQLTRLLASSEAQSVTVVVLDLDHFKAVNDQYGHDVGDVVLKHFATQLHLHSRRDDLFGRLGGEEFLLVLKGLELPAVKSALERLMNALRQGLTLPNGSQFTYTCSAGVAHAKSGELPLDLLQRADKALYVAKQNGRNQYRLAD